MKREPRNRGRMSQCETTCRMLRALSSGHWTTFKIASVTGLSVKTVRRYIQVLSLYFEVHEHGEGHNQHYYWLDDQRLQHAIRPTEAKHPHPTDIHLLAEEPSKQSALEFP